MIDWERGGKTRPGESFVLISKGGKNKARRITSRKVEQSTMVSHTLCPSVFPDEVPKAGNASCQEKLGQKETIHNETS